MNFKPNIDSKLKQMSTFSFVVVVFFLEDLEITVGLM